MTNQKFQGFLIVLSFVAFVTWVILTLFSISHSGEPEGLGFIFSGQMRRDAHGCQWRDCDVDGTRCCENHSRSLAVNIRPEFEILFSAPAALHAKYYQESMPDEVVLNFAWAVVFISILAAVAYIFVAMFFEDRKSPVHVRPTIMSNTLLISLCLVPLLMIGWLFSFDRELLGLSIALLAIATAACYIALGLLCKRVYDNTYLESNETRVMLWLIRVLLQNGLALLATWLTVLTCFSITDVLLYRDSFGLFDAVKIEIFPIEDASSVMLAFLLALIILWFELDLLVFENYTRYIFSIYPFLILVSAGLVAKLQTPTTFRNLVFSGVTLAFCLFALLFRIIFFFCCWKKRKNSKG